MNGTILPVMAGATAGADYFVDKRINNNATYVIAAVTAANLLLPEKASGIPLTSSINLGAGAYLVFDALKMDTQNDPDLQKERLIKLAVGALLITLNLDAVKDVFEGIKKWFEKLKPAEEEKHE